MQASAIGGVAIWLLATMSPAPDLAMTPHSRPRPEHHSVLTPQALPRLQQALNRTAPILKVRDLQIVMDRALVEVCERARCRWLQLTAGDARCSGSRIGPFCVRGDDGLTRRGRAALTRALSPVRSQTVWKLIRVKKPARKPARRIERQRSVPKPTPVKIPAPRREHQPEEASQRTPAFIGAQVALELSFLIACVSISLLVGLLIGRAVNRRWPRVHLSPPLARWLVIGLPILGVVLWIVDPTRAATTIPAFVLVVLVGVVAGWQSVHGAKRRGGVTAWVAKLTLALALFLGTGEAMMVVIRPHPNLQIVRNSPTTRLRLLHGVPVWQQQNPQERWQTGCVLRWPKAKRILIFGSSILYGTKVSAKQAVSGQLQQRFDRRLGKGAVCVMNFAQPGFSAQNSFAVARDRVAQFPGSLIVWQIWDSDSTIYRLLGDSAYGVEWVVTDSKGYPRSLALPSWLHHGLFRYSRLYEYGSLAVTARRNQTNTGERFTRRVLPKLEALRRLAVRHRCSLRLYMAPRLSLPFREQTGKHARFGAKWGNYQVVARWADAGRIPRTNIAKLLIDQDYRKVRMDSCCHYNPHGHAVLADKMAADLLPHVEAMASP